MAHTHSADQNTSTAAQRGGPGPRRVALVSVAAASFLVIIKLAAGLLTGSLGLVAEAAHSGSDLVAALLTLFAVTVAGKPADDDHQFGHGKAEHLAALAESAFLIAVSGWIAVTATVRLTSSGAHAVEHAGWGIAVLVVVIVVDASRTVLSHRAAKEHHSAALHANALHFGSDLAGSFAVLIGLIGVSLGFAKADAVAALFVAMLVIGVAFRLLRGSIDVLMDKADKRTLLAVEEAIAEMQRPPTVRRVRARHAAGRNFVDVVIAVRADAGLELAHSRADEVERAIEAELPGSDVVVHVEPTAKRGGIREAATAAALGVSRVHEVHNVDVLHRTDGHDEVTLHVKVEPELTLRDGHDIAARVEDQIREAIPGLDRVTTHIEPLQAPVEVSLLGDSGGSDIRAQASAVVNEVTGFDPLLTEILTSSQGTVLLTTVLLPSDFTVHEAHEKAGIISRKIKERCPALDAVTVHTEPNENNPDQSLA